MAERVVVGLEAVQVEHDEHERRRLVVGEPLLEVEDEPAPVAEPRQRVGERFLTGRLEQLNALAEREDCAHDHHSDRGRRKSDRDHVEAHEVVVDEERQADQGEERGERERLPAVGAHDPEPRHGLPRSARDQHERSRPADVEDAALDVAALGGLVEVRGVGDREHRVAGGDERPGAVEAPAGQREHGDDEREQQKVGEGIGEVRRDDERAPSGRAQHLVEDDGSAERPDSECGDQPVEPEVALELADPLSEQECERHVADRVEGEPQEVRDGRDRNVLLGRQDDVVVEVAGRPERGVPRP